MVQLLFFSHLNRSETGNKYIVWPYLLQNSVLMTIAMNRVLDQDGGIRILPSMFCLNTRTVVGGNVMGAYTVATTASSFDKNRTYYGHKAQSRSNNCTEIQE